MPRPGMGEDARMWVEVEGSVSCVTGGDARLWVSLVLTVWVIPQLVSPRGISPLFSSMGWLSMGWLSRSGCGSILDVVMGGLVSFGVCSW